MGKQLRVQRRGKGGSVFRVPSYPDVHKLSYKNMDGVVMDIVHDKLKTAPIAKVKYKDNSIGYIVATEGMSVGSNISQFVKPLKKFKEGDIICSIETFPNSGPKLCRASGSSAIVVSKSKKECVIQLASKRLMALNPNSMATAGVAAGEGKKEKPLLKAGRMFYISHKKGKVWPRTSGVAMNATSHPFGGSGRGHVRKPVNRHTPPGRKVGLMWPKRTGKKRGKIEISKKVKR